VYNATQRRVKRGFMENAMSESRLSIRVDETLKKQAEEIFQKLGMNMSTGVNIYLSRVVDDKGIPFDLKLRLHDSAKTIENKAKAAVAEAIQAMKKKGTPIARYDDEKKQPYLEYPDGKRKYVK
jgi:DNA-damage-inducible protein J